MDEIYAAELVAAGARAAVLDGAAAGARRPVRAEVIRRCCHELAGQIDPRGLRLANVAVTGCLDLTGLAVPFPLSFESCEFDAAPVVEGADLFGLSLTGCPRLPGLLGNGLRVRRDLNLSRSHINGAHWTSASTSKRSAIWLCEADIGGRLVCAGTSIDCQGDRSMQADRLRTGGAVRLIDAFRAHGEVRMIGARIGGSVDLTAVLIESRSGPALDLGSAVIEGNVFLISDTADRRPVIRGRLDMASTQIAGRLLLRNAVVAARTDGPFGSIYAKSEVSGVAVSAERLSVGGEVTLAGRCEVAGTLDLSKAGMSGVSIGGGCELRAPGRTAVDLNSAEIRAGLILDQGAVVEGTIRLAGAVIHGTLGLHGTLSRPERQSLVAANQLAVDGDVSLANLRTEGGRVNFHGAALGRLSAAGARLHNPGGHSIRFNQAAVKGSVRLVNGFTSAGVVALDGATIQGQLQLTGGEFTGPPLLAGGGHRHAVEAISATVGGGMDLGWKAVSPSVDFTDATTTLLADDPATWPEEFTIAGLSYERFAEPEGAPRSRVWDAGARSAWLGRAEFDSGNYEQAATVFRHHGYAREAEQILMAQRRHARQVDRPGTAWWRRAVEAAYSFIGYGYRPSRVLWLLAVLLVAVTVSLELPASQATLRSTNGNGAVYETTGLLTPAAPGARAQRGAPVAGDSCGDGAVRCFSPVLYAIDTVVPLISLDQRATWYPDPNVPGGQLMLWWLNLATLLGWLLSSIFVLSLARLSRSP